MHRRFPTCGARSLRESRVHAHYGLPYPDYRFLCTLSASRRRIKGLPNYQLHTVSAACGYLLERHHHALADAEACAEIALRLFG